VERHLVESLEPAAMLIERQCRTWLDFGSGAGFPTIPLAMAGIGDRWVMVESRRPKTLFLRKVLQDILLPGVSVVHDRLENLVANDQFDGFTARATEAIGPTLRLAALHVRPGGTACLWKGSSWQDELAAGQEWKENWDLERSIQLEGRPNVIVLFTRK
jgi:16S rRNA (guanine527-N7)-methyltransferase